MNRHEKNLNKQRNIELVILYFKYRKIFNIGFQSYKIFKNKIIYITGITHKTYIRNIFEIMLSRNIFQIKFIRKSRFYIFNPYNLNTDNIGYNINSENQYFINFN